MKRKHSLFKNKLTIVVMGRSGSGKGTQAEFILRKFKKTGVWHVETGRFLRKIIKKTNPTTIIARRLMTKGEIFPSWFPAFTWLKGLIEKGYADRYLVFDGAPRTIWEAELLDWVMRWHGRSLPLCIYVDVNVQEATKRLLLRARGDDNKAAISRRMRFFAKDVLPVIRYYQKRERLIRVDGSPRENIVWRSVDSALRVRLGKQWPS